MLATGAIKTTEATDQEQERQYAKKQTDVKQERIQTTAMNHRQLTCEGWSVENIENIKKKLRKYRKYRIQKIETYHIL